MSSIVGDDSQARPALAHLPLALALSPLPFAAMKSEKELAFCKTLRGARLGEVCRMLDRTSKFPRRAAHSMSPRAPRACDGSASSGGR